MTQISRRYLSPKVQERMYEILINAVGKAKSQNDVVNFLTDLLTPTERIMLAKRLAIAYLLVKGNYTHREMSQMLRVSVTTIHRVSLTLNIQGNGYRKIISSLMRDEKVEEFMNKIGDVLTAIPPSHRDWKTWRINREKGIRAQKKAF